MPWTPARAWPVLNAHQLRLPSGPPEDAFLQLSRLPRNSLWQRNGGNVAGAMAPCHLAPAASPGADVGETGRGKLFLPPHLWSSPPTQPPLSRTLLSPFSLSPVGEQHWSSPHCSHHTPKSLLAVTEGYLRGLKPQFIPCSLRVQWLDATRAPLQTSSLPHPMGPLRPVARQPQEARTGQAQGPPRPHPPAADQAAEARLPCDAT